MRNKDELLNQNNELVQKQADEIIEIFKEIRKAVSHKIKKSARQYGFTDAQLEVIFNLFKTPSITLNELSSQMGLTKSTVSGIVDRLNKQGVVIREIPEDNRRIVKLSISEEFKKNNDICSMKRKVVSDLIADSIKNVEPEEVEKIIYGLKKFSFVLKDSE